MTFSSHNIQDLSSYKVNCEEILINNLSESPSKEIDIEIMFNIISPETMGMNIKDRIKVIKRDLKISKLIDDNFPMRWFESFVEQCEKDYL